MSRTIVFLRCVRVSKQCCPVEDLCSKEPGCLTLPDSHAEQSGGNLLSTSTCKGCCCCRAKRWQVTELMTLLRVLTCQARNICCILKQMWIDLGQPPQLVYASTPPILP